MKPKLRQLHLANLEIQTLWPNCPKNNSMTLVFRLDKSLEGFSPNTINDVELLRFPIFLNLRKYWEMFFSLLTAVGPQ